MTRKLFLQFKAEEWTHEQLESLTEAVSCISDEDVEVVATPKDVALLDEEQVEALLGDLTQMVD